MSMIVEQNNGNAYDIIKDCKLEIEENKKSLESINEAIEALEDEIASLECCIDDESDETQRTKNEKELKELNVELETQIILKNDVLERIKTLNDEIEYQKKKII